MKLRTKLGENENEAKVPELAPPVRLLAEKLLRHYAMATGMRVTHFRARSRALVAACLDEMEGDDAAKEVRIRAVIAEAVSESQTRGIAHPPLSFVFNVRHVRRRLERLAEAEHLARKSAEAAGDMFAAGFDRALAEARGERAVGRDVNSAALERARAFIDNRLVTDVERVKDFEELAARAGAGRDAPLPSRGPRAAPKPAENRPARGRTGSGPTERRDTSKDVSGPADALRVLASLFATVDDSRAVVVSAAEAPLTAAERCQLEAAQRQACARWARAG